MSNQDNLYSRSIAAIGMATQKKLFTLRVLVSGLRGVGLEVAKNLILAGLHTVTLHDDAIISLSDLGTNFFINESHVSQNRAESVISKLQALNPNVSVNIHRGEITREVISQHSLVLLTESDSATLIRVNSICRDLSPQVGFVSVETWGTAGHVFVDFGDNFEISDKNGSALRTYLVGNISRSNPGVVKLNDEDKHWFQDGDYIKFKEVEGMTPLNDGRERKVTYIDPHSFSIDEDTTDYPDYIKYGTVEEVRKPFHYDFRPYEISIKNPEGLKPFMHVDYLKENRPANLHLAMLAIRKFQEIHGFLPEIHNEDHANLCVAYAREINEASEDFSLETIDESVIKNVSKYARLQISPITSIFGGIAAQEVIKFTGKFTPIQQWLHMDWFELIQPSASISDSRYHDLQAIIGEEGLNKLKSANLFMVGSGALGCEFLKLFALSGVCCGTGELTVTDDDNVEISNLTRQFLFNITNVGQSKSECATRIAKIMNPEINVTALKNRACPETENLFNDRFWEKLNAVFGAVDNASARIFIDRKCVYYKKPLFESGTEGTKANSQAIIPYLTQSYEDTPQPTETKAKSCTLKHYPYEISHCIDWSREKLSDFFTSGPDELNKYLENPEAYLQKLGSIGHFDMQMAQLKLLKEFLELSGISSFDDCIIIARHKFNELFYEEIRSLLHQCPPGTKDKHGKDLWTGTRRLPEPCIFDTEKENHIDFIESYANLLAFNLNIPQNRDRNYIKEIASKVQVKEFIPRKIKIDDNEEQRPASEAEIKLKEELISWLKGFSLENIKPMTPISFEKDDDSNFHIDFIHNASSLRANNYRISTIERHQTKVIAGKIIQPSQQPLQLLLELWSLSLLNILLGLK
ncbi:unnamed protein product [Blepharisma stoltei]|uniref:Ubiquitin-activating enzyme E1 n=1 Tax=Blepharisma stoltei TaxID=1481888 RepID=A0AAU9IM17_9CILI|nr:unnamed protein product [Blepharisma stoltei]